MKRPQINWRSFYDESKYKLTAVREIRLVGLQNRSITSAPMEPGRDVFIWAEIDMQCVPNTKQGYDTGWKGNGAGRNTRYVTQIIVNAHTDKWTFAYMGKVVNWPPRFRFTQEAKQLIYAEARRLANVLADDGSNHGRADTDDSGASF